MLDGKSIAFPVHGNLFGCINWQTSALFKNMGSIAFCQLQSNSTQFHLISSVSNSINIFINSNSGLIQKIPKHLTICAMSCLSGHHCDISYHLLRYWDKSYVVTDSTPLEMIKKCLIYFLCIITIQVLPFLYLMPHTRVLPYVNFQWLHLEYKNQ